MILNLEIFNLTKETLTVKDVAKICKKYNPKLMLKKLMMRYLI